ncbi:g114 [Coccomyxa elongata]
MAICRLLRLRGVPILRQLQLEEALLRADSANYCIINEGTPEPAIVMGISGKPDALIHMEAAKAAGIQVIKRFTGGGTVVVDHNTTFCSLIFRGADVEGVECYPRPVMQWSEGFYKSVFAPHGDFSLRDHDYTFGQRKFGGNAQAITKQRWLHHTSFLWDFDPSNMALLKHPDRVPEYRAGRSHLDFVCRLKDFMTRAAVTEGILDALAQAGFQAEPTDLDELEEVMKRDYIRNTRVIDL